VLNARLAVAVPLVCGTNPTLNDALRPAASVYGNDMPLNLNSELFTVAEEIVTLLPLALSVALIVLLVPTATLPKLKLVGEIPNWPPLTPDPDSGTVIVKFEGLQLNDKLPLALPADLGVKVTFRVKLCPGVSVSGSDNPVKPNPAPVTVAWEMVSFEFAELVSVSVEVLVLLTCTLPKLRLAGFAASFCWVVAELGRAAAGTLRLSQITNGSTPANTNSFRASWGKGMQ
jgi:hypothetical protein